ncbi:unnamed protein product [Callosobruchus maculatus]|uniref:WAP domain-containing protein n=1 Tax=Callosobruchus maculatus TaxID=64391 RepID=A0A653CK49_CALMS|nr:unnamed protein product [Callosobruchus maculatus]
MKYVLFVFILAVSYLELCSASVENCYNACPPSSYCKNGVCILPKRPKPKLSTLPPETEEPETEEPETEEPKTEEPDTEEPETEEPETEEPETEELDTKLPETEREITPSEKIFTFPTGEEEEAEEEEEEDRIISEEEDTTKPADSKNCYNACPPGSYCKNGVCILPKRPKPKFSTLPPETEPPETEEPETEEPDTEEPDTKEPETEEPETEEPETEELDTELPASERGITFSEKIFTFPIEEEEEQDRIISEEKENCHNACPPGSYCKNGICILPKRPKPKPSTLPPETEEPETEESETEEPETEEPETEPTEVEPSTTEDYLYFGV